MIKGLMGSRGIAINGGSSPSLPYVSPNISNPMTGMLRINGTEMQVFDGNGWQMVGSSYATAELDTETIMLLEWVKRKMLEEERLLSLPSDHPAVKLARENVNRAKQELARAEEQLKITEILSQDE